MEMVSQMLNLPLWIALMILAALLAGGEQTPTPRGAVATVPAPRGRRNISAQAGAGPGEHAGATGAAILAVWR